MKPLCVARYMLKKFWSECHDDIEIALFGIVIFIAIICAAWWEHTYPELANLLFTTITDFWQNIKPFVAVSFGLILIALTVVAIINLVGYILKLAKEAIEFCKQRQGD